MSIPLNGPGPYLDGMLQLAVVEPGETSDGTVVLGTLLDVPCSQCGRPLRALADMDLRDPRLAFVLHGLATRGDDSPTRLRIPACEQCTGTRWIYTDVDLAGGVRNARVRPEPRRESINPFTREKMYFRGSDEKVPVDPDAKWRPVTVRVIVSSANVSEPMDLGVGGTIHTQQEWNWPACIRCQELMTYVATVAYVLDGNCYYGFWCRGCGVATSYCDID